MKKTLLFFYILLSELAFSQALNIEWQKCLGGTWNETAYSVTQTPDGGYISVGTTYSIDGDITLNHGSMDLWVQKVNSSGILQWQKCYGGSQDEFGFCIITTSDGGYLISGATCSFDGDVIGNHTSSAGYWDAWLIKISSTGTIQWQKCYGGTGSEYANSVIQTTDGGYIFTGSCQLNNGDVTGNHGNEDIWCVKVNSSGVLQWQKSFGGSGDERGCQIKATSGGGFIICGWTVSFNGDVIGNHGNKDAWILKLTSTGTLQWQKCFGGSNVETADGISLTTDGGYIFVGQSNSSNGDVTLNNGNQDVWAVKISNTGVLQWEKSYGGTNTDYANKILQTTDGGYILSANTNSNNINVTGLHQSGFDVWLLKINSIGTLIWQKCYGSYSNDYVYDIQITTDGGLILAGNAKTNTGDVSGYHGGLSDTWLVKLSENNSTNSVTEALKDKFYISPNPITSTFTINGIESIDNIISINLTDINGKIVKKMELDMLTFNIQEINSGVYLLVINTRVSTETKRIIKL
jgi:hypothetical protein